MRADPAASSCIENIGPGQRHLRLAAGVLSLALGLAAAIALQSNRWAWSTGAMFLLFFGGAVGIFQARDRT